MKRVAGGLRKQHNQPEQQAHSKPTQNPSKCTSPPQNSSNHRLCTAKIHTQNCATHSFTANAKQAALNLINNEK